jgi:AcrR family transcriptional regulator
MADGLTPAPARTATRTRRRLPASQRRAVILDAALRVFAARGFHTASMDEIAREAGVSKAVVYDHFPSKQELYAALLEQIGERVEKIVEAALLPFDVEEAQRVRMALEAFFRYVEEHPAGSRLLLLELLGADTSELGRALEEGLATRLAETFGSDPRVFAGHPDRDRQLLVFAELIKSGLHGLAAWWYRHPDVPREALVQRSFDVVWPALVRAARPGRDGRGS